METLQSAINRLTFSEQRSQRIGFLFEHYLDFEMSEGGSPLTQVGQALRKGHEILGEVFKENQQFVVCLRILLENSKTETTSKTLRKIKSQLRNLDFDSKMPLEFWLSQDSEAPYWRCEGEEAVLNIAFVSEKDKMTELLWAACVADFRPIKPRLDAKIFLYDFERSLVAHPYDDQGLSISTTDIEALRSLSRKLSKFTHTLT